MADISKYEGNINRVISGLQTMYRTVGGHSLSAATHIFNQTANEIEIRFSVNDSSLMELLANRLRVQTDYGRITPPAEDPRQREGKKDWLIRCYPGELPPLADKITKLSTDRGFTDILTDAVAGRRKQAEKAGERSERNRPKICRPDAFRRSRPDAPRPRIRRPSDNDTGRF